MPEAIPQQLVVFSLGSEEHALPIGTVDEIIRYSEPRAVAEAGLADHVLPLGELGAAIAREVGVT